MSFRCGEGEAKIIGGFNVISRYFQKVAMFSIDHAKIRSECALPSHFVLACGVGQSRTIHNIVCRKLQETIKETIIGLQPAIDGIQYSGDER